MATLKSLPVHRYSVVIFTFSGPLGLQNSTLLFGNRVALNPGLGGVRDVASAIISHEQINKTESAIFKLWMLCFQRISFQIILNRLPIWNSQNCSRFPLAFVAGSSQGHWWGFISQNYVVLPIFFLMNAVFIALKGTHSLFLFSSIALFMLFRVKLRVFYFICLVRLFQSRLPWWSPRWGSWLLRFSIFRNVCICILHVSSVVGLLFLILVAIIGASSRENLSSGFSTRKDSNRPAQPQKLARGLKFRI